jgi:hypothetical protein
MTWCCKGLEDLSGRSTSMEQEFTQTGGARCGRGFMFGMNFTIPFACLHISKDSMVLSVSLFGIWRRTLTFQRSDIRQLRWKRGLFSLGLQIEHSISSYPPFVLFWASDRKTLTEGLRGFGYEISNHNDAA